MCTSMKRQAFPSSRSDSKSLASDMTLFSGELFCLLLITPGREFRSLRTNHLATNQQVESVETFSAHRSTFCS